MLAKNTKEYSKLLSCRQLIETLHIHIGRKAEAGQDFELELKQLQSARAHETKYKIDLDRKLHPEAYPD